MQSDAQIRKRIASVMRLARGTRSVLATARGSGVTCRQIDRLERQGVERVDFSVVYLLSLFHGVHPGDAMASGPIPRKRAALRPWPDNAPSLTAADAGLRRRVRSLRLGNNLGTPALAAAAHVHQAWLVRLELGSVKVDVVRICKIGTALGMSGADMLPEPFVTCEEVT